MEIAKVVGNELKQARKAKGLTQKAVAEKFFMTQQQYSRFENGVFELNYNQIVELCKFLDITPNDLFNF
ncbi:MAG: helix-turn-helix transcriptional regulator [Clostridia bacterium]|nr:helix-turn-helix transcriptional regulator [Clostridia bacterium]